MYIKLLYFEKGKENPVIHDMSPLTQHLCVFFCQCFCVWSTGWPLSELPSVTHTLIASSCSPGSHVKSIPLSPALCSAPALHLPSLAISDLYLMSFPVLKERICRLYSACLCMYIYRGETRASCHTVQLVQLHNSVMLMFISDTWFLTLLN